MTINLRIKAKADSRIQHHTEKEFFFPFHEQQKKEFNYRNIPTPKNTSPNNRYVLLFRFSQLHHFITPKKQQQSREATDSCSSHSLALSGRCYKTFCYRTAIYRTFTFVWLLFESDQMKYRINTIPPARGLDIYIYRLSYKYIPSLSLPVNIYHISVN